MDATVDEAKTAALEMAENARSACEFLKAMSHETRLRVLCFLIEGEKSVSELEEALNIRQASVSQQLQRLRAERLVTTRREGKAVYYSLASNDARDLIDVLYKLFCSKNECR